MMFIPMLSLFIAIFLGKPETFRPPKWIILFYIPTVILLLLILTNDLHQLAFSFPANEIWTDKNYKYEFVYYLAISWEIVCAIIAFIVLVFKCRHSHWQKYLPAVILICSIIYIFLYISNVNWLRVIGGDIAAAQCLMIVAILESCIHCGIIPTNTDYDALFEANNLKVQIVDSEYNVQYASSNAPKLSVAAMKQSKSGTTALDKNTLLKSNPIPGGYVLWLEDITEITTLLEELEENRQSISESNHLEHENYNTKVKINALREKNRLYDLLQEQTASQIDLLNKLLTQYDNESNPNIQHKLLAKAAVVGAYIKRRGNLMFIGEKSKITDTYELSLCLKESFSNLELMGTDCAIDISEKNSIMTTDAIRIYDFFEAVVEKGLDNLHSVWLKSRNLNNFIVFHLEVECISELSALSNLSDCYTYEDGVWCFTLRIQKAGEQYDNIL